MGRRRRSRDQLAVILFALAVVITIVGASFALGYLLGKLLL